MMELQLPGNQQLAISIRLLCVIHAIFLLLTGWFQEALRMQVSILQIMYVHIVTTIQQLLESQTIIPLPQWELENAAHVIESLHGFQQHSLIHPLHQVPVGIAISMGLQPSKGQHIFHLLTLQALVMHVTRLADGFQLHLTLTILELVMQTILVHRHVNLVIHLTAQV